MSLATTTSTGTATPGSLSGEAPSGEFLQVPDSLKQQLGHYRARLWRIKLIEAIAVTLSALVLGWLVVFAFDRWIETPGWLRGVILLAIFATASIIPLFVYRWIVQRRTLEQLAILLSQKLPSVGDSLLGVIELAANHREQSRSPALCQAAMRQVAADAKDRDLMVALPDSRYRQLSFLAIGLIAAVAVLAIAVPSATGNSLARLLQPWGGPARYTFTRVDSLPEQWHVAHGEPVSVALQLDANSQWQPTAATMWVGHQQPITASLSEDRYEFLVPPQIGPQEVSLRVGDVVQQVSLLPTLRPEVTAVRAKVQLPEYLELPEPLIKDARGGTLAVVNGSTATIEVEASRDLAVALVNGVVVDGNAQRPEKNFFTTPQITVTEPSQKMTLEWRDEYDLAGRQPLELSIIGVNDEAPTLICDGIPRQEVILDSELIKFTVRATDDFGIRQIGIQWRGAAAGLLAEPAAGERVLAAGGSDKATLEAVGTFSAASYGISPQPIELFVWAEDYLPGRPRVLSAPYTLYVLTPEQHAIWMTEQLSKWHRQALEVRDHEMQLYETNKELRELSGDELDLAENRERIERQAQAERTNGRRLARLSEIGDQLVQRASRNPEIGVGHLERWAEMLQVLKDISGNRMPNVAELLKEAAESPKLAQGETKPSGPSAGQVRNSPAGAPSETKPGDTPAKPPAPTIVDSESSQNPAEGQMDEPGAPKKPSNSALRLPVTTLTGPAKPPGEKKPEQPADEKMAEAVEAQEDLLAEFEKLADELNNVLANLEGSTLVKRLKAASRKQSLVAERIGGELEDAFGRRNARLEDEVVDVLKQMSVEEDKSVTDVSFIMDDMAAYFERRRFARFKTVLDEMKSAEVIDGLRQIATEIPNQQGLSVAQCEYWSDSLDRWAEDLVDPACSGQCPGGKSPASLPPSIVLEVLQILEAEVNLRDETRVAEQAREAVELEQHMEEALRLSQTQATLRDRVFAVGNRIMELPDAEKHFGKELELLSQVDAVMGEATQILAVPNTGSQAVAAETEAIELLLQSRRINPKSGGGGGSSPGGGGSGSTNDSALALLGSGVNSKEVREDKGVTQTTGSAGTVLPEEFRAGLDEYFNRIEQGGSQ